MSRVASKKIHVCFVLPVPLLPLKGASFTCFNQAVVLDNLGYKVTILTSKPKGLSGNDPYSRLSLRGIKVVDSLPSKAGSGLSSHFYPLLFSWPHIWATLKKEKPDIVHVHNPTDIIPMVVAIVNTFYKVPYIFQLNDPGPESIVSIIGLKRTKRFI
ncbi:MAG: glycosyltransferase, partial [Candidatus Omnitrophica bacterium]|nr:glycosyltransferase [Candidatus Omnitrophota bacterium]